MMNIFQRTFAAALLASTVSALAPIGRAELPPTAYQSMKEKASEVLKIEVTRVSIQTRDDSDLRHISVYADARIVGVTRSKSRAKVGDKISLRYTTFEVLAQGWAGPRPLQIAKTGTTYNAWLKKAGSYFYPTAQGASLEIVN